MRSVANMILKWVDRFNSFIEGVGGKILKLGAVLHPGIVDQDIDGVAVGLEQ